MLFPDEIDARGVELPRYQATRAAEAGEEGVGLDMYAYGPAKQPAWDILLELAERWAVEPGWQHPASDPLVAARTAEPDRPGR